MYNKTELSPQFLMVYGTAPQLRKVLEQFTCNRYTKILGNLHINIDDKWLPMYVLIRQTTDNMTPSFV